MPIDLPGGLRLSRGGFDVGLLTTDVVTTDVGPMIAFWHGECGLPIERVFEPSPGVTQYKLTMHGAVLKVNHVPSSSGRPARMGAIRLLQLVDDEIDEPRHLRDPDGNLVQLVPPDGAPSSFGVHLAVSDERSAAEFYGGVLGLQLVGDRVYDVAGAALSFAWSPDVALGTNTGARGFGYITLQVMDVVSAHALVCGRGANEVMAPSDSAYSGGSSVSFVSDPDGNLIELSERPDLVGRAI
jgi:catechol 2,3-dioxygenase-like lactoylglutathione lyase family enzyme